MSYTTEMFLIVVTAIVIIFKAYNVSLYKLNGIISVNKLIISCILIGLFLQFNLIISNNNLDRLFLDSIAIYSNQMVDFTTVMFFLHLAAIILVAQVFSSDTKKIVVSLILVLVTFYFMLKKSDNFLIVNLNSCYLDLQINSLNNLKSELKFFQSKIGLLDLQKQILELGLNVQERELRLLEDRGARLLMQTFIIAIAKYYFPVFPDQGPYSPLTPDPNSLMF